MRRRRRVLSGSIRERVWQMLSYGGYSRNRKVSSDGCEALYAKVGVPFLPAARRFYERCGGLFSDCEIVFETGSNGREFYLVSLDCARHEHGTENHPLCGWKINGYTNKKITIRFI